MDIGTIQAIGYLAMFAIGVFIVGALIGTVFDGIQKRAYDNRKRWDREA